MSGLLVVARRDGAPVDRRTFDAAMPRALKRGTDVAMHAEASFVVGKFSGPHDDRADLSPVRDARGYAIVDGRLDDPEALRRDLRLPPGRSTTALLLAAWRQFGTSIADKVPGAWALVVVDPAERRVALARDALGVRPLHVAVGVDVVVVGTDAVTVAAAIGARPDPAGIARWLDHPPPRDPGTWWAGVQALPPSGWRVIDAEDRSGRGFDPYRVEPRDLGDARAHGEVLLTRLVDATTRALPEPGPPDRKPAVAIALSGGLDSALVAAIAGRLRPKRTRAFTRVTADPHADEAEHARAVAADAGLLWSAVRLDELDVFLDEDRAADALGEPVSDPHTAHLVAELDAAHRVGVRRLLTGYAGDDVISLGHEAIGGLLRRGQLGAAVREARAVAAAFGNTPRAILSTFALPVAFPRLTALARRRHPDPTPWLRPSWDEALRAGAEPRMDDPHAWHAAGLARAHTSWGLSYHERLAAGLGVDLRTPYLDLGLARAALAVPWPRKLHDGFDRYPLRIAAEGLLPDAVRWRRGKANFAPLFRARFRALAPARLAALAADPAPLAPWVDPDALRRRIAAWEAGSDADTTVLFRWVTAARWLHRHA